MSEQVIIGIDTSCYTTSLAMIDAGGGLLLDRRIILRVKPREKGLRQSDAVFQHLQNLPSLAELPLANRSYRAVAASTRPRPVDGSYLPVFRAGASFGEALSKLLGIPFLATSHQEGHIRAGLADGIRLERFLAWHLSGGTTELLLVEAAEPGFKIKRIGGTSDLQVGQFVDRIGVTLGTPFPAGPGLEKMALLSEDPGVLPVVVKDLELSFSGPEAAAARLAASGSIGRNDLARQVFNCITQGLLKVTRKAVAEIGAIPVLLVGGVASNEIIRAGLLQSGLADGIEFHFGPKQLSGDNAAGVGWIAHDFLVKGTESE